MLLVLIKGKCFDLYRRRIKIQWCCIWLELWLCGASLVCVSLHCLYYALWTWWPLPPAWAHGHSLWIKLNSGDFWYSCCLHHLLQQKLLLLFHSFKFNCFSLVPCFSNHSFYFQPKAQLLLLAFACVSSTLWSNLTNSCDMMWIEHAGTGVFWNEWYQWKMELLPWQAVSSAQHQRWQGSVYEQPWNGDVEGRTPGGHHPCAPNTL